jgi:hypothetical protein
MTNAPKGCPFCGAKAFHFSDDCISYIGCSECGCRLHGYGGAPSMLWEHWDTRAAPKVADISSYYVAETQSDTP